MENIWKNVWMTLLAVTTIGIIMLIGVVIIKDIKIERYILSEYNNEQVGKCYEIIEKRSWGCDRCIRLRQDVSLDSTLKIIDHLNESLKK